MSRLAAIGLVLLAGCAKQKAAPAKQEPAAAAPVTGTAAVDPAAATEEARAQGVLGPSNQGAFDDKGEGGPDFQAKGGGGEEIGTVKLGNVELAGKGDATRVSAALTNRLDELRACYQNALGTKPGLAGHLTLTFTIKPDGSFDAVAVSRSTLKDEILETCIIDSVKTAKLAAPLVKVPVKGSISVGFLR